MREPAVRPDKNTAKEAAPENVDADVAPGLGREGPDGTKR